MHQPALSVDTRGVHAEIYNHMCVLIINNLVLLVPADAEVIH